MINSNIPTVPEFFCFRFLFLSPTAAFGIMIVWKSQVKLYVYSACKCLSADSKGTLRIIRLATNLCEKEEENFVIGKDRMWCNTQQEVFQTNSPSFNKIWVKVVCWKLVPHKLSLEETQLCEFRIQNFSWETKGKHEPIGYIYQLNPMQLIYAYV